MYNPFFHFAEVPVFAVGLTAVQSNPNRDITIGMHLGKIWKGG